MAPLESRRVLLASPRSFRAGVDRAVKIVERLLQQRPGTPVFVRNTHVVADLPARGAVFVDELDQIPDPPPEDAVVVFSAHGVRGEVVATVPEHWTVNTLLKQALSLAATQPQYDQRGDAL
jgi:4-hydroxy-3-methylbut-2-en-1-yl diphosphate reductase